MANPNPIFDTPTKIKHGKSLLSIMDEKKKSSKLLKPPLMKSSPSNGSTVSSRSLTDFLSSLSPSLLPSSLSVVLQTSSLTLIKLTLKKRLLLSNDDKPKKKTQKEPKLAAYDIHWFNLTLMKNKCLKHTSTNNVPSTQEEQLTFLLSKYKASDIKTAFADAIGKVGKAARKAFYPLPLCKEKLIINFLELIYDGKSIMVDNSKNSFR